MMGIILLVIPLGFLVVGILYFSVTLWKLKSPIQKRTPQGVAVISPIEKRTFFFRIGITEKDITTLNTKILSDEDIEFLFYCIYIKDHDKIVEMHNIEMNLKKKKVSVQEWPFLKMPPITINEVGMTKSTRDSKNKGEFLWVQN